MMHEHILGGCTPTPLSHYLKALGILRLVAEQKDTQAAGRWQGECFVLRTALPQEELKRFFLEEYQPTPVISPWNGRAGFLEGEEPDSSSRSGAVLLRDFRESKGERLKPYRDLIKQLDAISSLNEMNKIRSQKKAKETEKKRRKDSGLWAEEDKILLAGLIAREAFLKENLFVCLRNTLDEAQLDWLDGVVALGEDKAFAPLLGGSGGVEGSMDLGVNFMLNIKNLFSLSTESSAPLAKKWLDSCLFGDVSQIRLDNSSGSLSPGNIGGPNSTTGFSAKMAINPWEYLLMIEGALVLKPSMTKKLESSQNSSLSYPFTFYPSSSGSSSVSLIDEKKTRAGKSELWMPLWPAYSGYQEILTCFKEGSAILSRRKARSGLDFARAISNLGADRGIDQFQRFIFLKRSGDNDMAVPVGRYRVNRTHQIDLIANLDSDNWFERLRLFARDKNASGRIKQLVKRLEDEIFSLTQAGGRLTLQNILLLLGQIQIVCADSAKTRDAVSPIPPLGMQWALEGDDGSHEFRLACSLAGSTSMRNYLFPLKENGRRLEWSPGNPQSVWAGGDLVTNLLRVLDRKLIEAQQKQEDKPFSGHPSADLAAVMAFLRRETDDKRISGLIAGLVNVDLPRRFNDRELISGNPPAAYCLMKPLFTPDNVLQQIGLLPPTVNLPLPREIVTLLRTGNRDLAERAIGIAWRRIRIAKLKLPTYPDHPPALIGLDSARLAAALMIQLSLNDLARICKPFIPIKAAS